MKKLICYSFAALIFSAACQNNPATQEISGNDSITEAAGLTEMAGNEAVAATPESNPFPWDFPLSTGARFENGQWAISPYTFYHTTLDKGGDLTDQALIFYSATIDSAGETYSKLDRRVMPNSLIIPIPAGQTAKKGDILLTWWQSGSGMQRAIVTDAKNPGTPAVDYLDLDYSDDKENPGFANENSGEVLKPNTFVKLTDGEWNPGMPIAIRSGSKWKPAKLINATTDRVIASVFASHIISVGRSECKLLPLSPDFRKGDAVSVVFVDEFQDGYEVVKYDKGIGRVWVKQTGKDKIKIVNIFQVTKSL